MKICFLIQRFNKPSSRYRVLQYLAEIKKAGFQPDVFQVSGHFWSRFFVLNNARKFPLIFIQKKLFHPLELWFIKSKGAKLFYDFDDAIMFRHKPVPGAYSKTRYRQFAAMMRSCKAVFSGNHFLEKQALKEANKVVYLPTTVDPYSQKTKSNWENKGSIVLGWLGSPSTLIYLEKIIPAIVELAKKYPLILKVVSSSFPEKKGLTIIKKQWSEKEESEDLLSFDIGLAPLENDPWCEGKCGLKLLQYMASALPTVSSPYGGQRDIIQEGVNGYSAVDLNEWKIKLENLIQDAGKRKMFGLSARKTVEEQFSLQAGAQTLINVLNEK